MNNCWVFGNMPGWCHCSPTPYGLGMLKTLSMGKTRWVLLKVHTLIPAMKKLYPAADMKDLDKICANILDMDAKGLESLKQNGCQPFYTVQSIWETIYVPAGWLAAECPEGMLVYGARKCVVVASAGNHEAYSSFVNLYQELGKEVKRQILVLARLKPSA